MYQRILVPVDGSDTSARGLEEAIAVARLTGASLRLIHVVDDLSVAMAMDGSWGATGNWLEQLRESGAQLLEKSVATVREAGLSAEGVLYDSFAGPVDQQVINEALSWKAELVVLGTHGRRGIGRALLGSSAERILRSSPVPVLLVRAPMAATAADRAPASVRVSLPSAALSNEHV